MLINAKTLKGFKLHALDGEIGNVKEFYFDDHSWNIRYLVADTGNWLMGRQVLISPHALTAVNSEARYIVTDLTKKQIEDSPSLNSDKPVSRQFEESYYGYYGWPLYWGGANMLEFYPSIEVDSKEAAQDEKKWDTHLRSTRDVSGYEIQASDGEIGHVDDFTIDEGWAIRYLVIDTQNWWLGKRVLISPQWIKRVSWDESKVFVNLLREAIKQSPPYTEDALLTRDYENKLHQHYNSQGYWIDEPATKNPAR